MPMMKSTDQKATVPTMTINECVNCGQDVPVEDVVQDSGQVDMVGTAHADVFCTHTCLERYLESYDPTPLY